MDTVPNYFATSARLVLFALWLFALPSRGSGTDSQPVPAGTAPASTPVDSKEEPGAGTSVNIASITPGNGSVMTDRYFRLILNDIATNGKLAALRPDVTAALGLTHNGETLKIRQDAFEDPFGAVHFIAPLDNDGGYIICCAAKEKACDFRLDGNRNLVTAVSIPADGKVSIVPVKDAQKLLEVEWLFWVDTAIRLEVSK